MSQTSEPLRFNVDRRLGKEIGIIGPYADVPAYQIGHDASGKIRHVNGRLVTAEYGPLGDRFVAHPSWAELVETAHQFQRRFDAHSNDAFYCHLLLHEVDAFREGPMQRMFEDIEKAASGGSA